MTTVTKGKLFRQDMELWDGVSKTANRKDSTGGTITGLVVGYEVDVLASYGNGDSYTWQTINDCIRRIGSASCTLIFNPGTWTIDQDLTIGSNFTCRIPAGAVFSVSSGKTLTFSGPVIRDSSTWTSGSGTVTESGTRTFTGLIDLTGAVLQGGTPLVFEGATANAFETRIVVTDPTADRTVTFPDADVDLSSIPSLSGNNSWSGNQTFSGSILDSLSIDSTDAGATVAPNLDLYRNSASPAASDVLGTVNFYGEDSAGNKQLYSRVYCFLEDPTSTGESGRIRIEAIQGGLARLSAEFKDGQVLGSPTGSFKGDGTLNAASGLYDNGVRINPSGTAKAWVRFNGTGTIATVASFNLDGATPLTDNNVGDYSINFDTDFASTTSYLGLGNAGTTGTPSAGNAFVATVGTYATGAARVLTHDNNLDAVSDADNISFVFWGTQ